ncbi:type III PLP-dependent enzyme domain-containing protein [Aurantimonas marina]|uniref:alanine racemase n=1 Tax=Aurantimonas marina TaxID=2780508 RepID=UPI0019CFC2F4|nr:alanine racemase [Aurantimonas marina]
MAELPDIPNAGAGAAGGEAANLPHARLEGIAERYGTPCFVYDAAAMRHAAGRLRAAFPEGAALFYPVKANPNPAIVGLFAALGFGAEVASRGELALAMATGIPAKRIVWSGPAKTDDDLGAAVAARIFALQVESPGEIQRLAAIARQVGRPAAAVLRLDLPQDAGARRGDWAGASSFGMDEATAAAILGVRDRLAPVEIIGFHNHPTSGSLNAADFVRRFATLIEAVGRLSQGFAPRFVNFGGGFGAPFYADDPALDLDPIAAFLRGPEVQAVVGDAPPPQLGFEMGRYVTGPAGRYLARVVAVKRTAGRRFAALDGGIHHLMVVSGTLRFLRRPVAVSGPPADESKSEPTELTGPLCAPTDRLASAVPLSKTLAPGGLIVFSGCGAYGKQASPLNFLGHDWPPEILVDGDHERLIARRVRFDEVLALQSPDHPAAAGPGRVPP